MSVEYSPDSETCLNTFTVLCCHLCVNTLLPFLVRCSDTPSNLLIMFSPLDSTVLTLRPALYNGKRSSVPPRHRKKAPHGIRSCRVLFLVTIAMLFPAVFVLTLSTLERLRLITMRRTNAAICSTTVDLKAHVESCDQTKLHPPHIATTGAGRDISVCNPGMSHIVERWVCSRTG